MQLVDGISGMPVTFIRRYLFSHAKCGVFHTVPPSVFSRGWICSIQSHPPEVIRAVSCTWRTSVTSFIYIFVHAVAMASYIVKLDDNLFCTN